MLGIWLTHLEAFSGGIKWIENDHPTRADTTQSSYLNYFSFNHLTYFCIKTGQGWFDNLCGKMF